jgi:DNA-binding NarL/FixJ family response regulator
VVSTNIYDPDQIAQVMAEIAEGKQVYQGPPSLETGLTPRERDVVRLAALGKDNREIAHKLYVTPRTVSNVISQVLSKLGLRDRVRLCYYYLDILPFIREEFTTES